MTPGHPPESLPSTRVEPSLGEMVGSLITDSLHLFRTELRLARSEVISRVHAAAGGAAMIGVGMVLMLGAIFTFLGALVGWLTPSLGAGWAALAVAGGAACIAGLLVAIGLRRLTPARLVPPEVAVSAKRDFEAMQGK